MRTIATLLPLGSKMLTKAPSGLGTVRTDQPHTPSGYILPPEQPAKAAEGFPKSFSRDALWTIFKRGPKHPHIAPLTYYQPQVSLDGNDTHILKLEALARLKDADSQEIIGPGQFVRHLQEDQELGVRPAIYTTCKAVRDIARFKTQGLLDPRFRGVSINVSPKLPQKYLATHIERLVDRHSIDPNMLTVEFTEDGPVDGTAGAVRTMVELSRRGVRFALDDIGSPHGIYSLDDLRNLIFDLPWIRELKLDMSVLQKAHREYLGQLSMEGRECSRLQSALEDILGHGKHAVVEGAETEDQAEFVRRMVKRRKLDPRHIRLQGFFRNGRPAGYSETCEKLRKIA